MTLHPQVIEKKGKKEFVVLPYSEFLRIQEALENFADLRELRREKEESKSRLTTSLDKAVKSLGL
ncbi:hypothetical protein ES702_02087 [subsurface metagenome]